MKQMNKLKRIRPNSFPYVKCVTQIKYLRLKYLGRVFLLFFSLLFFFYFFGFSLGIGLVLFIIFYRHFLFLFFSSFKFNTTYSFYFC